MFTSKRYEQLLRQRRRYERQGSMEAIHLISQLLERNCALIGTDKINLVLDSLPAQLISHNDGSHTYLAHSTTLEKAEQVMQTGLHVNGLFLHPELPDVQGTAMLLAGPQEKDRVAINEFGIVYRYKGSLRDKAEDNSAKVIVELPMPYPGTIYESDSFANTPLSHADGKFLVCENTNDTGHYRIPARYVKGYFNLVTGKFTANPVFAIKN